jgi:hypothetical protein
LKLSIWLSLAAVAVGTQQVVVAVLADTVRLFSGNLALAVLPLNLK